MTASEVLEKCSNNLLAYLEKYGYDKYESKSNLIILNCIINLMRSGDASHYLVDDDYTALYRVILYLRDTDRVLFKGVNMIDIDPSDRVDTYTLIYDFIYS